MFTILDPKEKQWNNMQKQYICRATSEHKGAGKTTLNTWTRNGDTGSFVGVILWN